MFSRYSEWRLARGFAVSGTRKTRRRRVKVVCLVRRPLVFILFAKIGVWECACVMQNSLFGQCILTSNTLPRTFEKLKITRLIDCYKEEQIVTNYFAGISRPFLFWPLDLSFPHLPPPPPNSISKSRTCIWERKWLEFCESRFRTVSLILLPRFQQSKESFEDNNSLASFCDK